MTSNLHLLGAPEYFFYVEIRVRVVNNKHNLKFKNQYLTRFLIKIQHFISRRTAAYDVLFIQKMKVEY